MLEQAAVRRWKRPRHEQEQRGILGLPNVEEDALAAFLRSLMDEFAPTAQQ
jgi:hypothetical protein